MFKRVCEPEIMDDAIEAEEYSDIDNRDVNEIFVKMMVSLIGNAPACIVDLGCGPGDIALDLAERLPKVEIIAIDLSEAMLAIARRRAKERGLESRVQFVCTDVKATELPALSADAVMANSLVHHIHNSQALFAEIARIAKPDSAIFLKDLRRPNSATHLDQLVRNTLNNQSPLQQQMFAESLAAALRPDEVETLWNETGRRAAIIESVGDLHWQLVQPFGASMTTTQNNRVK